MLSKKLKAGISKKCMIHNKEDAVKLAIVITETECINELVEIHEKVAKEMKKSKKQEAYAGSAARL